MSRSLPHLTLTTSTSSLSPTSPILQSSSSEHPSLLSHDPHIHCDDSRRGCGSSDLQSRKSYEPRRIELDRNLEVEHQDQTRDRIMGDDYQSAITEDMDEFGKIGVKSFSYNQSLIHSDNDIAEGIADSELEDGQLRKMLASPLYIQEREGDFVLLEKPRVSGKPDAMVVQKREASAQQTQADRSRRESLMSSSSREPKVSGKPDAMFSFDNEPASNTFLARDRGNEQGVQFESSVHSFSRSDDPSNVEGSLLEGNKDQFA